MKCPKCEIIDLSMSDRSGVEIDYCPSCRGVWLDRGELDKIIVRSSQAGGHERQEVSPARPKYDDDYRPSRGRDDDDDYRHGGNRKKRGGFLGELFDF